MNLKQTEKQIQTLILEWLSWNGVFAWRNNTGSIFVKGSGGKMRMFKAGLKGSSDIIGILKGGMFLAIEVKTSKGMVSDCQQEFIDNINNKGGVAFVARCLKDVKDGLKDYFL